MKENTNTQVDFEWQAIQIAKELTVAKLSNASVASSTEEVGEHIGKMFLAIHKEVKKSFTNSDK
ncbi:hypothetical protein [Enterococcus wangshanyuanii]|uniref:Uncharacterized protein n=1 Tax=Enterococcus wangshanyuanii TaxID=2005703 RepID=A0ABQ1PVM7_9ENTE|nr:hypothetical protein [Enterococcus wangshanyuanii]GGD04873.1 hypothetical protein GCM10011573_37950 [Enterococcus wangshanyuanii]